VVVSPRETTPRHISDEMSEDEQDRLLAVVRCT
jgi:hypothetical protein